MPFELSGAFPSVCYSTFFFRALFPQIFYSYEPSGNEGKTLSKLPKNIQRDTKSWVPKTEATRLPCSFLVLEIKKH